MSMCPNCKNIGSHFVPPSLDKEIEENLEKSAEIINKIVDKIGLEDGKSCGHKGCLRHVNHPCENCRRIAGKPIKLK
jgi:hypothetical protein